MPLSQPDTPKEFEVNALDRGEPPEAEACSSPSQAPAAPPENSVLRTPFEEAFANAELLPTPAVRESASQPPGVASPSPFEEAFASALSAAPDELPPNLPSALLSAELPTPPPLPEAAFGETVSMEPRAILDSELPTPPPLPMTAMPILIQPPAVPVEDRADVPPDNVDPEITLRRPPSYLAGEGLSDVEAAACALFRASFDKLLGIRIDQPQGEAARLLKLRQRREAARFQAFLDGESRAAHPEAIQGILALGNLYLATQLKPTRLFWLVNEQRQVALARGLEHCGQLRAMVSGAATFEALGPEIHAAFFQVVEQILDFVRFCHRGDLDPAARSSVERYLEAVRKRRFATTAGDRLDHT